MKEDDTTAELIVDGSTIRVTVSGAFDVDTHAYREIAQAASPGPWAECGKELDRQCPCCFVWDASGYVVVHSDPNADELRAPPDKRLANARHVATFDPPTVLALLDRIDELEREAVCDCCGRDKVNAPCPVCDNDECQSRQERARSDGKR